MNQTVRSNHPNPPDDDDEINLTDLLRRLAVGVHRRFVILRFTLLTLMLLVIVGVVGALVLKPPLMSYSTVVTFSFPQAEQGRYPNGSPFSLADITNSNVMQAVWRKNQLESLGISLRDFSQSVSISPYADNERFIRARYESMLTRRNISQTEISAIEREFRTELDASIRKQARLSLIAPFRSVLSGELANKVLIDILTEWSTQAIRELGATSIPVAEVEVFNVSILNRGSPFQITDYFYRSASNLNQTINRIAAFPGGENLRDPQTGRSLEDINKRVRDVMRYWILEFDNFSQRGFSTTDIEIRSAETRLLELELSRDILLAEAETFRRSLVDYDAIRQRDTLSNGNHLDPRGQANGLQLEGDAIQRLINLGSQNKDAEYRQKLTDQRVKAELRASAMQEEIARLARRIQAAQINTVGIAGDTQQLNAYTQEIVVQIQELAESLKRIQAVQMGKFMDDSGLLYTSSSVVSQPATSLSRWFGLPAGLLIFLLATLLLLRSLNRFGRRSVVASTETVVTH